MPRWRTILLVLLLLLVVCLTAGGVFLATLDLNRYRTELALALESAINRPVELGEARLSLRRGLALEFSDLQIGLRQEDAPGLSVERVLLKIALHRLLLRQVAFDEIVLEAPRLVLRLGPEGEGAVQKHPGPLLIDQSLLEAALVRTLRIERGALLILDQRAPLHPRTFLAENLQARLTNLSLGRRGEIMLTADLPGPDQTATLSLGSQIRLPSNFRLWREARFDLNLRLQDFDPATLPLPENLPERFRTQGPLSLRLSLAGIPGENLDVSAEIRLEEPAPLPFIPLAVQTLQAGARITFLPQSLRMANLDLALDDLRMRGSLEATRWPQGFQLEGSLAQVDLPLALARPWLSRLPSSEGEEGRLLRLGNVRLQGPAPAALRPVLTALLPLEARGVPPSGELDIRGEGELRGLLQPLPEQEGLPIAPFRFALTAPEGSELEEGLQLAIAGECPAAFLTPFISSPLRERVALGGEIAFEVLGAARPDRLTWALQADLKGLALESGALLRKEAGSPGRLALSGELTEESLILSEGLLDLPPLALQASGTLARKGRRASRLTLTLLPLQLSGSPALFPLLDSMEPSGMIEGRLVLAGTQGTLSSRRGSLTLKGVGLQLGSELARLHRIGGRVRLGDDQMDLSLPQALLGTSPLNITGSLRYDDPRLQLRVRGKSILARDLVFSSPDAVLRDVDGGLVIHGSGLVFQQIRVRLDGGTIATVNGTLEDFHTPQVRLQAEAERADIGEVIALFAGPEGEEPPPEPPPGHEPILVVVEAKASAGHLGQLQFTQAEGTVTAVGGLLSVFPLTFRSDQGYFNGRVAWNSRVEGLPLLAISGHLEDFDAARLHREQLQRRGLVTGRLRGDFYLEGRGTGMDFLRTSQGGFYIDIEDGVLRKFKTLSKVFSILNISQIFALKLPDMSSRGMPFDRLTATFSLQDGLLATEDLLIDSQAMNLSLVGGIDLVKDRLDLTLGVKPLKTVDKIVSSIPVAGWVLAGKEKTLVTAHFRVTGPSSDPEVVPIPVTSLSETVLGVFKRILGLPGKMAADVERVIGQEN